jgi:hypothetical protein
MLITSVIRILRKSMRSGEFLLRPYHSDGCGGTESLISTVFSPMIIVVAISGLGNVAAFIIHRRIDFTTVGGVVLTCVLFLAAYFWPAVVLRGAIVAEKNRQLSEVSQRQSQLYSELLAQQTGPDVLKAHVDALERLTALTGDVKRLPNWPHFRKVAGVLGFVGSSPIVAWLVRQGSEYMSNLFQSLSI